MSVLESLLVVKLWFCVRLWSERKCMRMRMWMCRPILNRALLCLSAISLSTFAVITIAIDTEGMIRRSATKYVKKCLLSTILIGTNLVDCYQCHCFTDFFSSCLIFSSPNLFSHLVTIKLELTYILVVTHTHKHTSNTWTVDNFMMLDV